MNQEDLEFQLRVLRPERGDLLVFEREDAEWPEDEVEAIAKGLRGAVCANDVSVLFMGPDQSLRRLPAQQARELVETYERRFGR